MKFAKWFFPPDDVLLAISPAQKEGRRVGVKYKGAIKEFLEGGVDTLFAVVAEEPFLHNNRVAKEMLIRDIMALVDDAESYRSIVKLAREAGVPLVNPVTTDTADNETIDLLRASLNPMFKKDLAKVDAEYDKMVKP